jgi:hypothetical protein
MRKELKAGNLFCKNAFCLCIPNYCFVPEHSFLLEGSSPVPGVKSVRVGQKKNVKEEAATICYAAFCQELIRNL